MARYKKRADGRYMANVYTHTDDKTGIRKYETVYAHSILELENRKAEVRDTVNKGTYSNDKGLTLEKWATKWLEVEKATAGVKTKEMYERLVNKHIIPTIGNIRLKELCKSDIQGLINKNAEHARTCQQIKMCVNQILESAIDDGLLYKNVCRSINMPPLIKEEKRGLTDDEKKAILKTNFTDKEKAFIYIIQYCGLRRGEALALSRSDIDFSKNIIKVRNVTVFEKSSVSLKTMPKSLCGIRDIPMPEILRVYLKEYIKSLQGLYLFEMERKPGLMTKSSYDKFWKNIVEKINEAAGGNSNLKVINGLGAHVFRHNYATMLYYAGIDVKEAQYLLGHSDVVLTLNIYTHLEHKKNSAVEKLDKFLAL